MTSPGSPLPDDHRPGWPAAASSLDRTTLRKDGRASDLGWGREDWLDDEVPGTVRHRGSRHRLLLVAATLPWVLVVALLLLPGRLAGDGGDDVGPSADLEPEPVDDRSLAGSERPERDTVEATDEPADPSADQRPTEEPDGIDPAGPAASAASASEEGPAAALAILIARAWLTGMEPLLDAPGLEGPQDARYAEHLTVEAVDRLSADTAVVTVVAILLEGEDALGAEVLRLAVPIVWDDAGVRAAGTPWPLALPDLAITPLGVERELTDPDLHLAAVGALEDAGFASVDLRRLEDSGRGPVVAHLDARAPDGTSLSGTVWLRPHADGFVVGGALGSARDPS